MKFNEIYQRAASLVDAASIVRTEQLERMFDVNHVDAQTAQFYAHFPFVETLILTQRKSI